MKMPDLLNFYINDDCIVKESMIDSKRNIAQVEVVMDKKTFKECYKKWILEDKENISNSSEKSNNWIPVSEEYPKESGTYWVSTKSGIPYLSAFYIGLSSFEIPDVIAWAPLIIPEPYKVVPTSKEVENDKDDK